ncbi:uncharacterized protein TRIADDRAFT_53951 [Trichoplax adhaerens]|uniref:Myosin motor domain-containing protein n=1 Tax=Trichoplax adhaerens TaxID=10228 RepID=B3RMH0_TRIAD|nr:hypothetical protein TRIADDRAFT_53951 [Trichoplax adhaerens]EDV28363.1 hypothetical protein TRIADDRAFT_53951 [Trichoplax adhaerens]|eukprot:XP_002110197.1 hypothetical protein TRIADDRAFT_53951 [Trichoplax adhaerens]
MASLQAVKSRQQTNAQHTTVGNVNSPTSNANHHGSRSKSYQENGHHPHGDTTPIVNHRHDGNSRQKRIENRRQQESPDRENNTPSNSNSTKRQKSSSHHEIINLNRRSTKDSLPNHTTNHGRPSDSHHENNDLITVNNGSDIVNLIHQLVILRKKFAKLQDECKEKLRLNGGASSDEATASETECTTIFKELNSIEEMISSIKSLVVDYNAEYNWETSVTDQNEQTKSLVDDLIHMPGPHTEDAVIKMLHMRLKAKELHCRIGPVLIALNGYWKNGRDLHWLTSDSPVSKDYPYLLNIIYEASRRLQETKRPQVIILSGESGSGKTFTSRLMTKMFFEHVGGGLSSEMYKNVAAAITALAPLTTAKVDTNLDSSRVGYFTEIAFSEGLIVSGKLTYVSLDQTRITATLKGEGNYHIFYHLLSGLSQEEKVKFYLQGYTTRNLAYLSSKDFEELNPNKLAFNKWKAALSLLGIKFTDVVHILAAILLLGNVQFSDPDEKDHKSSGSNGSSTEVKSAARNLGVSGISLFRCLTTRTKLIRGQPVRSLNTPEVSKAACNALAMTLYARMLSAIIRRVNLLLRGHATQTKNASSLSSDSAGSSVSSTEPKDASESNKNPNEHSHFKRFPSTDLKKQSNLLKGCTGSLGILDMYGFEITNTNRLEQLCINFCSETIQHFYNTHLFESTADAFRNDIGMEIDLGYVNNTPCIELLISPIGILSILNQECLNPRGDTETFINKIKAEHDDNCWFSKQSDSEFGIIHHHGDVLYDSSDLITSNRDIISDDVISIFRSQNCSFDFLTHLFSQDLRSSRGNGGLPANSHRITSSSSDSNDTTDYRRTFLQDFQLQIDNLLKMAAEADSYFIRCIRTNTNEVPNVFDRVTVARQLRALEVLETLNLMTSGLPYQLPLLTFISRYRCFCSNNPDGGVENSRHLCEAILNIFLERLDQSKLSSENVNWAVGDNFVFLSEDAMQYLEYMRNILREQATVIIQALVRMYICRKAYKKMKSSQEMRNKSRRSLLNNSKSKTRQSSLSDGDNTRHPVPNSPTTPNGNVVICDEDVIQKTCELYGFNAATPPSIPQSRPYAVIGNSRIEFPQTRIMRQPFRHDDLPWKVIRVGETVTAIAASPKAGCFLGEYRGYRLHIPRRLTEIIIICLSLVGD